MTDAEIDGLALEVQARLGPHLPTDEWRRMLAEGPRAVPRRRIDHAPTHDAATQVR